MFTKPKCRSNGLHETHYLVEPEAGIGPATYALRVRCSTTELPGRDANSTDSFRVVCAIAVLGRGF